MSVLWPWTDLPPPLPVKYTVQSFNAWKHGMPLLSCIRYSPVVTWWLGCMDRSHITSELRYTVPKSLPRIAFWSRIADCRENVMWQYQIWLNLAETYMSATIISQSAAQLATWIVDCAAPWDTKGKPPSSAPCIQCCNAILNICHDVCKVLVESLWSLFS